MQCMECIHAMHTVWNMPRTCAHLEENKQEKRMNFIPLKKLDLGADWMCREKFSDR